MLLTAAIMGLCLQSPQEMKIWVDRGYDPNQPNAYSVSGAPELTQKDAWASANGRALEDYREQLQGLADRQALAAAPVWLPGFLRDGAVRDWTSEQMRRLKPRVLDRDLLVRDHGFGRSYQAFLLLDELDPNLATSSRQLGRKLSAEAQEFAAKCGGTLGLWGILFFLVFWFDRLSKGYMTGRLYLLGSMLGLGAPILLVLL